MITIIDYGAGNITSVEKALRHLGHRALVTCDPGEVRRATKLVLPGVGHFASTKRIESSGIRAAVEEAIRRGVPFLGICVGMQWLYERSSEAPDVRGLGALSGTVDRFAECDGHKVPHVGWNKIRKIDHQSRLLRDIADESFAYYTHSYQAPAGENVVATTSYGCTFAAVVERGNIFGVQFHPEKSSAMGLKVLQNFCELPA